MKRLFNSCVLVMVMLALPFSAQAANRWWDGANAGSTGDGASDGGTANWDTSTLNWDQGNTLSRVAWVNGNNDTAIFGGTAGTVSLGTGITVGGLQFDTASYTIQSDTITWGASGGIVANQNATISSVIAGAASIVITKTGSGNLTLSGVNTHTGTNIVNAGTVTVSGGSGVKGTMIVNTGATVVAGTHNTLGGLSVLTVNSGTLNVSVYAQGSSPATINLDNATITGGGGYLGGTATYNLTGTNSMTSSSIDIRGGNVVLNAISGRSTFSSIIQNFGGTFTKTGNGTVILSGANSYTTATTINGGLLLVNGSTHASSAVTVAAGAMLGGSGTVNGTVSVSSGGNLAPGGAPATIGKLTLGSTLSLSGASLLFDLNSATTAGTTYDQIAATGALTMSGSNVIVLNAPTNGIAVGTYTLMTFATSTASTFTFADGTTSMVIGGSTLTLVNGTTSLQLTVSGATASFASSNLRWYGPSGATLWDTSTANWTKNGAASTYTAGDHVTFDDSAATYTVTGSGSPASVSLNNVTPYVISAVIGGTGTMTKTRSGSTTLSAYNTFSGGTIVNQGTLALAVGGGSGPVRGALTINSNATVSLTTSDALGSTAGVNVNPVNIVTGTLNNAVSGNQGYNTDFNLTGGRMTSTGGGTFHFNAKSINSLASSTEATISAGITIRTSPLTISNAVGATASGVDMAISGAIGGGALSLNKIGPGTLKLTAANTYSGGTIVSNGTLVLDNTGKNGTTPILAANNNLTITNATVSLAGGNALNAIYNTSGGTIILNGGGTLAASQATFNAHNVYHVKMDGGLLTAGAGTLNGALANWYVNGTISNTANSTISASLGYTGANGGVPVDVASGTTLLIAGPVVNINGANGVTKTGAGTLTLSGTNTYTGTTTVNAGALTLTGNRTVGTGHVHLNSTLNVQADLPVAVNSYMIVGSTSAGVVNHSAGTVTLLGNLELLIGNSSAAGAGTYNLSSAGVLNVGSGSANRGIMIGVNAGSAGNPIVAAFNMTGGTINNSNELMIGRTDDNNAKYHTASYTQSAGTAKHASLSVGGNGLAGEFSTAALTLTGGTFSNTTFARLSAGNSVTSTITIAGTADVYLPAFPTSRGTGSAADLIFDGGTLRPTAASATYMGGLTSAKIKAGGASFNVASGTDITITQNLLTDAVSTGGGLTKDGLGTLTLSGTNTYTGATTISSGTLEIGAAGQLGGSSYAGNISNNERLRFNSTALQTLSGVISGTGALIKINSGTLTLTGVNTFSGATMVSNGTLLVNNPGSLHANSVVTVASGGKLGGNGIVSGAVSVATSGILSPGSAVGTIGTFTLGSTLSLTGATLLYDLTSATTAGSTYDQIAVSGTLTMSGSNVIELNAPTGEAAVGTYTLMTFASSTASTFTFSGGSTTMTLGASTLTLVNGTTSLQLTISGAPAVFSDYGLLKWYGPGGATLWDTGTANWIKNGAATAYVAGDHVTFDDSALTYTVTGSGSPASVSLNNATPYTISATIGGTGTITKTRSGTVTLSAANTFSGGLRVNAGTIKMGNGSALGSGRVTLASGGTLDINGNTYSPNSSTLTSSNGSTIVNSHATIAPTFLVGGGTVLTIDSLLDDSSGAGINLDLGGSGAFVTFTCTSNKLRGAIQNIPNGGVTVANLNPGTFGTGDIPIGNANTTPTLVHTGSANSSDPSRSFNLKGGTAGGGGLISSAGGGTLTFGGAYATVAVSKYLYLRGTNTGNNTMAGLIWNGNGTVGVDKADAGTWILSGTNTYTGTTTLSAGTLKAGVVSVANVSGAFGLNSAVTIANAASAVLDLNGYNTQIGSLTGGGSTGGRVTLGSATLTVGGDNTSPSAFAGLISGSGGLTKIGTGTLRLSNTNTYTGPTTVSAGKLVVISGGYVNNGAATVASGATLGVQVTTNGNQWSCSSLTLNGGTTTNEFDYQVSPSTTIAPLQVNGDLINNGTLHVYIANGAFAAGTTYPLIKYTGNLTLGTLGTVTFASGAGGTLVNNPGNKSIDLYVSSVTPLIWSAGNGNWDINTTANWNSQSTVYTEGRPVQFDDTANGTGSYTVNVTTAVSPGGVIVSNATRDCFITNAAIAGGTYLTKSGAGTLNLYGANTYNGGTIVNGGTLAFLTGGAVVNIRGALTINTGATVNAGSGWSLGFASGSSVTSINIDHGTLKFANNAGGGGTAASTITMNGGTIASNGNQNSFDWFYGNTRTPVLTTIASPDRSTISANIFLRCDSATFNVPAGTTSDGMDLLVTGGIAGNTGEGTCAIIKSGTGKMVLSNVCSFAGGTTVNGGTLVLGYPGDPNIGTIRGTLTVNSGATVTSTVANSFGVAIGVSTLNINGGTMDLSRGQHHLWGTAVNMTGGTLKFSSDGANEHYNTVYTINSSASQAQILGVSGGAMRIRNSSTITFNVADGAQAVDLLVDFPISTAGDNGVTKTGAGTVEFTKGNSYTGPTAINAGRVFINGASSGGSAHTVEIGATLAGTGTVAGATTVNGSIAPGSITNPTGTLNVAGNVTWNGASGSAVTTRDWYFQLGPNNTSDILNITGNFLKGSGDQFRFNFGGTTNQGTFKLVDWTGTTTFSATNFSYDASSIGNFQEVLFQTNGSQLEVVLYGPCPTPPTATLGTSPTVCKGTTSASISYSNPQQSPTLYSIDYDNTANTVGGFADVSLTTLGASPISLAVPVNAPVGTYNGSLYLVNGAGCRSLAIPFTVTVIDTPSTPGAISGSASVCHDTSGVTYSIAAVSMATNYNWTVPANGTVTATNVAGTQITVNWGAAGSGNITVSAQNSCDTSASQSLTVTVHAGVPDAPVGNPARIVSETSFIASWSSVSEATGYYLDVARTADFGIGTFVVLDQAVAGTSYTVSGLTSGSNYYYRVRGTNSCGLGSNSATITAVPTPILAGWNVSGLSDYGSSPQTATEVNDDVTVGGLTRGAGLSGGTSAVRGWGATGWELTEADATNSGSYGTFTVKADTDRNVSFTSISTFDYRLDSANGPVSGKLQYSVDGSTFYDIATNTYSVNAAGASLLPIDLSGISILQNVPDYITVTFRIVNYGASSSSEPWYIYDKDNSAANDFEVRGTICVSPTSYALNGGGTFCSDSFSSTTLQLADSDVGVTYQLFTNSILYALGSPVAGTGNAISFGSHSAPGTYAVLATRDAGGCSEIVGMTTITVLTTPSAPTSLVAPLNGAQVELNWNAPAGTKTGYKVYRRTSSGSYGTAITTINSGATTNYVDSPAGGETYYYQVTALNDSCEGSASSPETGPVVVPNVCPNGVRPTLTTQGLTAQLTASVRVNVAPSLNISFVAADSSGCTPPTFEMSGLSGVSPGPSITDTPNSPAAGSVTRQITWTPGVGEVGTYPVTLKATDSEGNRTSITFVIYVGQQSDTVSGGVPSSQTNWNIPIMDIRVPSSGNATVEWESVNGIIYDVYSSTAPIGGGASWTRIVSGHEAAGSSTYTDVVASGSARYYHVVPAGQAANGRGVWGVVRPAVPGGINDGINGKITYMAPPVPATESDLDFSGNLGDDLAAALTDPDDRIYVMSPGVNPGWTTLRLVGGEWIIDGGGPYTTPLNPGQGFLISRDSGSASPTFEGPVGNDGSETIELAGGTPSNPAYNIIGLSQGKGLAASTAFDGISVVGSYDENQADQVVLLDSNGSWRRLIRRPDGSWYDTGNPNGQGETSLILMPGQAYYFIRRGSGATLSF